MTSSVFNGGYWVLAIVLLAVYCSLLSGGERGRRSTIAGLFRSTGAPTAAELLLVEPTDLQAPDAQR